MHNDEIVIKSQHDRYIEYLRNKYDNSVISYNKYKEFENHHQPQPPYNINEIPDWYPEVLKVYLSSVSSEMLISSYPCKIHLHTKSINELHNDAVKQYYDDIGSTIEERQKTFEYELEYNKGYSLDEIIEIGKHVEIIKSTLITVGNAGCSFNDLYCLINDKVFHVCYDDMVDSGIVNEYNYLKSSIVNGISLEDYLFKSS